MEQHANWRPEKDAIIFEDRRITYRQMNERVNALAKGLLDLGLKKGNLVAIFLYNCLEFVEITFAANKIGAIWMPINWRFAGDEIEYVINHSEAKIIFSEMDFHEVLASVKGRLPGVKQYVGVGKAIPAGWKGYDDIIEENLGIEVPEVEVELDDVERLMYTSGTTAYPKGALITYGNLYWKNFSHTSFLSVTSESIGLTVLPLYHSGGMDDPLTTILHAGGTDVIQRRYNPLDFLKAVDKEKVTHTLLVPSMLRMLLNEPTLQKYDLSSLKVIVDGGEKMPEPLIREFHDKLPNTWFCDGYGLTETASGDLNLAKEKMLTKIGCQGKPLPSVKVRLVDDKDNDVALGTPGELLLKGPKVFKGYWKDEKATAEALRGGWFHTGDIAYMDEEGDIYWVDRKKDMIKSGGENVASAEVERVINRLPQVYEVAVIGVPHPKWLEAPKAFVVLKEGQKLSEQDIVDHCSKHLAKFKVPKEVEFISQLPRNPSGKVLKRELRKRTGDANK